MASLVLDVLSRSMRTLLLLSSRPWFWVGCLAASLTLLVTGQLAPHIERQIAPATASPDQGLAVITPIPQAVSFPFHLPASVPGLPLSNPLDLFEDGFPLGPNDALHADIRNKGQGLYSHWDRHLYFSSSDRTDPRTNGRVYSYRIKSALHPNAVRLAWLLATLGILGLAAYSVRQRTSADAAPPAGDRNRPTGGVGVAVAALGVVGLLALGVLAAWSADRQGTIDVGLIEYAAPRGYVAPIAADIRWPLRAAARHSTIPGSALTIDESGKSLGRYEPDPRELRNQGEGRYGFYGDRLAFSTSDGADPRRNGRTYTWKLPVEVHPAAWTSLLALAAIGSLLVFRTSVLPALAWLVDRSKVRADAASVLTWTSVIQVSIVVLASGIAVYLVAFRWEHGHSSSLGFIGYLPISDAAGYFWCSVANSGIDTLTVMQYPIEWCARRIVYPSTLISYLGFTGWRPQLVLLVQAAVIGCAISVLAWVVARYIGRLAAIVTAFVLFIFAYEFAIGNFMTESLGFPLGLFGLTLLVAYAGGQRNTAILCSGLALFSIGMFARMGALFVLPLLALWACIAVFRSGAKRKIIVCSLALAALAAGPLLQVLLLVALGGDPANSGGNYATTLYGLSTGSRDWAQGYRDFPHFFLESSSETEAFAKLQAAAFQNIRNNPSVFLHSLLQNTQGYVTGAFKFGWLTRIDTLLTALWLVGIAWCIAHARQALAALLLAVAVGEFISVPLMFTGTSDHRVLAVSLGARVLLVGVGLTWLTSMFVASLVALFRPPALTARSTGADSTVDFSTRLAMVAGASLVVLALLPATPVRRLLALPFVTGTGCPHGQQELVARVGRESMAVTVGSPLNPVNERVLGLRVGQVEADPARSWWGEKLPELRQGTTLIYGIQLMPGVGGQLVPLLFEGQLPGNSDTPLSFCYDPEPTSTQLADFKFRRVYSVRTVPAL